MKRKIKIGIHKLLLFIVTLFFTFSCDNSVLFPTAKTKVVSDITSNSASCGGIIVNDNNVMTTIQGVCWSINPSPTINDNKTTSTTINRDFICKLSNLEPSTIYYVRAYLSNSDGTVYGNEVTFVTISKDVLSVSTIAPSYVSATSVMTGGNVISDGGDSVTVRGVCWNTTPIPTIDNNKSTDGAGSGAFITSLTDLLPGTIYYIRAYATNATGTVYGNELTFATSQATAVSITTTLPTGISTGGATAGGNISSDGGLGINARGVCWSTISNPTVNSNKTVDGSGTGAYASNITGLEPNTVYYLRAYATNILGTTYGNEVTFTTSLSSVLTLTTTAASVITTTTALAGGNITSDGGDAVTARGVCWSTSTGPTINSSITNNGIGIGTFGSNLSGLIPGTLYYLRAYATNANGTVYGNEVTFTSAQMVVPSITSTVPAGITTTTATSGGDITSDGGSSVTARGVCWSISANPTISNSKTVDGAGTGIFTSSLTGLLPGTVYYLRAYSTNASGTGYGNEVTFSTIQATSVTLSTTAVTGIATTGASSGGNITSDGGLQINVRGVCWSTNSSPTITDSKTTDGAGLGIFSSSLSGLQPNTKYYIRAYATNILGTTYGNELSFSTSLTAVLTLSTSAANTITTTTALAGGNITSDGGLSVTARGVCWSTTSNPTISSSISNNGIGVGAYSSNLSGLLPGTVYYVRAYATNANGTVYGNEVTFTTLSLNMPTLSSVVPTDVTINSATAGGDVSSDGGAAVTARGVCWSTTSSPTVSNSKTSDGTGTGAFVSNISGLLPGTMYYMRAYATNIIGTAYGNEISFTTTSLLLSTLTTNTVTTIATSTATAGGNITSDGGATVSARGVCWSVSANPTISNSKTSDGTGAGAFSSSLTGLTPATTYYVRAYATNSVGTAYGNQVTFTTAQQLVVPTLTTSSASAITAISASLGGAISSDGGSPVTARGVCWATSTSPTISNSITSNGTGTGSFTSSLTGLLSATTYYVRAYATNAVGTAYGNEISFATNAAVVNTAGTLTVNVLTTTYNGGYAPRNVHAIWIVNASDVFVKTLLANAAARISHLTNWVSKSGKNVVDATTGATKSTHGARAGTWDATNLSRVVVPDGTYKVCLEMTESNATGKFSTFTFVKGPTAVTLTPANVAGFSNISIVWTPK